METVCAKIPFQSGFCKEMLASGNMEFSEGCFGCCAGRHCDMPDSIYTCVPIKAPDKILGVLILCMKKGQHCDLKTFEMLNTVSEVIAGIIRRKQAEKDKKEYESHLIQSSKLAALGQMAAGVAHELNNPLTIVMGNTQYLLEHSDANAESSKVLAEINDASVRCKNIISSLLEFSKKNELKFKECSVNDLVDDVLHLVENETKIRNISVSRSYADNLPRIKVSYSHIEQVFLNIMINAVQAMGNGGMLSVKTDFSKDNDGIDIIFTDTGAGIALENITKVFEPFFTTKQHGGDMQVKSPGIGKGTCFSITLPVKLDNA
jgi:two-component system NtrC family sensor kinase